MLPGILNGRVFAYEAFSVLLDLLENSDIVDLVDDQLVFTTNICGMERLRSFNIPHAVDPYLFKDGVHELYISMSLDTFFIVIIKHLRSDFNVTTSQKRPRKASKAGVHRRR